jgi:hypothetical protein
LNCDAFKVNTGAISSVKIDTGVIDPQTMPDGVIYWGRLRDSGIDLWSYDEWYVDTTEKGSDIEGAMVDAKRAIMVARQGRFVRHYGAIKDVTALQPYARFPKSWITEDPSCRMVMVQSAPLPAPHQIDAVYSATVVA